MAEYVWVIGGGPIQTLAIEAAKARGYRVIVTDANPDAPGCKLADLDLPISTYDISGHIAFAKATVLSVDAVMTYGADVGPTVSAVAEVLGLPACGKEAAIDARSKISMRIGAFTGLNRRHPAYWVLDTWHDPQKARKEWFDAAESAGIAEYPCVVKAENACGSRGISLVERPEQWAEAIKHASEANHNSKFILVEEKLSGAEFVADYLIEKGKAHFIMGSTRIFSERFALEHGGVVPWVPSAEMQEIALGMAVTLGVKSGPFKVDYILDPRYGVCVGEVATRQSGGYDQISYPRLTRAKPVEVALDYALGLPFNREHLRVVNHPMGHTHACHYAPILEPGRFEGWVGADTERIFQTQAVHIRQNSGLIEPYTSNANRVLFVEAQGKSMAEAVMNAQKAASLIQPRYI